MRQPRQHGGLWLIMAVFLAMVLLLSGCGGGGGGGGEPRPQMGVDKTTLTFTASSEGGAAPAPQTFTITNAGDAGSTLAWSASSSEPWLTLSVSSGSLAKGEAVPVTATVSLAGLLQGTHNAVITLSGTDLAPTTIGVQLTIGPALTANPAALTFTVTQGSNPADQTMTLANASSLTVSWTATANQGWLTVAPASGSLAAGGQANNLKVSINSQNLATGTHLGTITIASGTGGVSGVTVPVTLTVTAPAVAASKVFVSGSAGVSELSNAVAARAVHKAAAGDQPAVLSDAKVTLTVLKADGSKSVTFTRTNASGAYSAEVSAAQDEKITVSIEKEGFTTLNKTITVKSGTDSRYTVSGNVAQAAVQVVKAENGVFKAGGGTGPGFRFGLMRTRSGERVAFASSAGVRAAAAGSLPDLDISIPAAWAPGATAVTTRLASFNPNDSNDRMMFPGEFVGVGGGTAAAAKADVTEYPLESVAFFQSNVTPNNGQPLAPTLATGASKAAAEPTVIYKWIPSEGCGAIRKYADRDATRAGIQVPLYTYNPNTGKWGYLGEGTLKTYENGVYTTVPESAAIAGDGKMGNLSCGTTDYYFEIVATDWYTWWNLDYPLVFSEPKTVCVTGTVLSDAAGNPPVPGAFVEADGYAAGGSSYAYTYSNTDGTFSMELRLGDAETIENYRFTAYNYATWPARSKTFVPTTVTDGSCKPASENPVIIEDPLGCLITGKLLETTDTGDRGFVGTWVEAYNSSYSYYNWAQTGSDGAFSLKSTCNEPITLKVWGDTLSVNANGTPIGNEESDNPGTKTVRLKDIKKTNTPPQAYTWVWPNPARAGQAVEIQSSAWDAEGNYPLTYSWTIKNSSNATVASSALQWFSWTPTTAGTYTAALTVTDSKGQSATPDPQTITVNEATNSPPVIWSSWAAAPLDCGGFPTLYAYAYDPDGDPLTYSWSAGSPTKVSEGVYQPTVNVSGTLTLTVSDGKASAQAKVTIPVVAGLQLYYAEAGPSAPIEGDTVTLEAFAWQAGGVAPTYSWSVLGPDKQPVDTSAVNTGDNSSVTFQGNTTGAYAVNLTVTGSCGETITRNFNVTVSPLSTSATFRYLQYRTYENPSLNGFRGWINYIDNGEPVTSSQLAGSRLLSPTGAILSSTPVFTSSSYLSAIWDKANSRFSQPDRGADSGYAFDLSAYSSMPAGEYTFETGLPNGRTIVTTLNYFGQVALPVVASSTMTSTWNTDGSLTLSWAEPTGTFDDYRVVFYRENSSSPIFHGTVLPGVNRVTLPASLYQQIVSEAGLTSPRLVWEVQTRSYGGTGINHARGFSNKVAVPPLPGSVIIIIQ